MYTSTQDELIGNDGCEQLSDDIQSKRDCVFYEENLKRLKHIHHSKCLFNRQSPLIPDIHFWFDETGVLYGKFLCTEQLQGYDTMVHGGILAAIIDASMAQCLMGHGIAAYTTDLSVKYRKPVLIDTPVTLTTKIECVKCNVLYSIKCEMVQKYNIVVQGTGRFYKINR